jgi:4-amino-4-deoxy-L-arabinose transferase-like glycosyltransferase
MFWMDKKIFTILFVSLFSRVFYTLFTHPLWWDGAVYLSMGKYLFSLGSIGFWEPIRPLAWVTMLGFGWFVGLDPIIWGYFLTTIFSLGIIYLTYLIGKELFNEQVGLYSSILISFTWIFFFFNVRLYTEIPSVFFGLVGLYFLIKRRDFISGIFLGLAFLTKFPQGLLLVGFMILLFPSFKRMFYLLLGFILITIPYFTFNFILYGSPIEVILFASEFVRNAGIWIFQESWYYYFVELFKENFLFVFAIVGICLLLKRRKYVLVVLFSLFFAYFSYFPHKELRFAILFLPYLAILASYGYYKLINHKVLFISLVLLLFLFHFHFEEPVYNDYFTILDGVEEVVLITHPQVGYGLDTVPELVYFPWFNTSQSLYWLEYIQSSSPKYVSLDTCEGGFICPPGELACEMNQAKIIGYLENNYERIFYSDRDRCEYLVYISKTAIKSS